MYKKILVPLDGSRQSEEALPLARTLAETNKADIVLLRVVEYPYTLYSLCKDYPPFDPDRSKELLSKKESLNRDVNHYLKRIASTLRTFEGKVFMEVVEGPVVDTILDSIEQLHIDLIVLSTCGQSGCRQCMIGSVADRMLREAQVPVILIRPALRISTPDPFLNHQAQLYP